jgi:hypothetical protein
LSCRSWCSEAASADRTIISSTPSTSIRGAQSRFRCSRGRGGSSPGSRRTSTLAWRQTSYGSSTLRHTRWGIHLSVFPGQMGSNPDRRAPWAPRRRPPSGGSPKMTKESITRSS